jgi:flagellar biosynthesis GTPase FlhF
MPFEMTRIRELIKQIQHYISTNLLIKRIQRYIITKILSKLFAYAIIRFLIAAVILWVGFVRSFFITERSNLICVRVGLPIIGLINYLLAQINPEHFTIFTASIVYYYIGLQLITYDNFGALFAHFIAEKDHPISLLMTPLLCKPQSNMVKRYITWRATIGLITGKSAMTSTGRATLIVGVMTGTTFIGTTILNNAAQARARQEARQDAEKARQEARQEAREEAARARQEARQDAEKARQEAHQEAREEAARNHERAREEAAWASQYAEKEASARKEARKQAEKDAARAYQEAARAREEARQFELYKARHAEWKNSSWGKGPEPTWEDKKKK